MLSKGERRQRKGRKALVLRCLGGHNDNIASLPHNSLRQIGPQNRQWSTAQIDGVGASAITLTDADSTVIIGTGNTGQDNLWRVNLSS